MMKRVGFFVSRQMTWRDVVFSGCSGWRSGTRAGTLKVTMTLISFSSAKRPAAAGAKLNRPQFHHTWPGERIGFWEKPEVTMRSALPRLTRRALFAGTGGALGWA